MTKNRTTKWVAMLALVCALVLVFAVPAASAASYSKVYGQTTDRVHVRDRASTNGTIIDNVVKNACVYVTGSDDSGSSTFVQVKYRASDGTVATGWICQSDGKTTYVKILSNDAAKKSYGVSGGNVPSKVVGTFTAAQRKASQSSADSTYIKEGSSGATVRDIQTKLKALGYYYADITGSVGEKTKAAIKSFQAKNGLTADGVAGPQTIAKIDAVYAAKGSPSVGTTSGASGGDIKLGSTGTDVAQLQRDLKTLGLYSAEITGSVGAKTEAAIREFQRKHGLSADGVAGAKTLAAIAAAVNGSSSSGTSSTGATLKLDSTGTAVSALQRNLSALGLYAAEITGHYGAKTQTAVREFQRRNGLSADGVAGAKTLAAIAAALGGSSASGTSSTGTTLKLDSTGAAVSALQQNLAALGLYSAEITGHYGAKTQTAVRKFQSQHGLSADGIAGAKTLDAIAKAVTAAGGTVAGGTDLANVSTLREGATGTAVRELQNMLAGLGYYYGEITGHYGTLTKKAVRAFQDAQGLTVDGVAGSSTINRLRSLAGGSSTNSGATTGSDSYGRITRDNVNLRQEPNMNASTKINAVLPQGTICRITKQVTTGDTVWLYVSATVGKFTYKGYVRRDMIETISTSGYENDTNSNWRDLLNSGEILGVVRVTGSSVNLRAEPAGEVLDHAPRGELYYVVAEQGTWYQLNNGLWIDSNYVKFVDDDEVREFFNGAGFEGPFGMEGSGYTSNNWQIKLVQQALRDLGYYGESYSISGTYGKATKGAVNDFRREHAIVQSDILDQRTYEAIVDEYIKQGGGSSAKTPGAGTVYNVDWFKFKSDLNKIGLKRGEGMNGNIVLTDLRTGKSLHIYVQSTGNHADCEPVSISDTNTLCSIFGVTYPSQIDYERRPMMVTITNDGKTYQFVCSIYAEVHGQQVITTNGYNGQFCLHFSGSMTHDSSKVDPDHQAAIQEAIQLLKDHQGITVVNFLGL